MLSAQKIHISFGALAALFVSACSSGPELAASSSPTETAPPAAPAGAECGTDTDCRAGTCIQNTCRSSAGADGVENGDESDVDCGGTVSPPCPDLRSCRTDRDCASAICRDGTCRPTTEHDGVKNAGETDIDCGGPHPDACETGKACAAGADCVSQVCTAATKTCAAPSYDDGVQNGAETDVDCGGPLAPRCATGRGCLEHSDCASNGCGFDKRCAAGATCTQLEGGQTCGPNESMTKQGDCCGRATIGNVTIDKYMVTAGRMRAFLGRVGGDVRGWAEKLPASKWNQAWTPMLPTSIDGPAGDPRNANTQLGPFYGKRSCETGHHTGHTFWTPPAHGDTKQFPQEMLDMKALNCVPWWLLSALCVFDGGHLATEPEIRAAYTNGGTTAFPWGARDTYKTDSVNDYAVGGWGYMTPDPPPTAIFDDQGFFDVAYYIAPPGRRPLGYSSTGVADLVGNLLEWVGDSQRQFVWKGSFENHAKEADYLQPPIDDDPYVVWRQPQLPWRWNDVAEMGSDPQNVNGYYAIGGRCAY